MNHTPTISIITVVYNAADHLAKTAQSVALQTYKDIEYIVVDGASKDKTLEVIHQNQSIISKYISEKDNGIYDAMNKGLKMATGKYVLFLNAGDVFHSNNTLEFIFTTRPPADVYYGDTLIVDERGTPIGPRRLPLPKNLSWKSLQMGMVVCHQSLIVKRTLCVEYNLDYKISADIDWTIRSLKKASSIEFCPIYVSNFLEGGMSKIKMRKGLIERYFILQHHFGIFNNIINHIKILIRLLF